MTEFEDKIKQQLIIRGFTKEQLLNNRGIIGATIDETILAVVKNFGLTAVGCCKEQFYCNNKDFDKDDNNCQKQCDMCKYLDTGKLQ